MDGLKIRLAIDVNYSDVAMGKLVRKGFQIMVVAQKNQSDDDWLSEAVEYEVEVVLSHDLDIPNWLDRNGYNHILYFEKVEDLMKHFTRRQA